MNVRPAGTFENRASHETNKRATARWLAALAVGFYLASSAPGRADTLVDINRPSSTIPGCVNT